MPEQLSTNLNGVEVRISSAGEGPPLLLLHGASGSNWRPGYDRLAERFHVYVPEHPGYGVTERPEWLETVQDLAIWYMDLIDHLELAPVLLAGHSLGGWAAAELASLCSHQIRKLALIDPAGVRIPGEQRLDLFLMNPEENVRSAYHEQKFAETILALQPTPEQAQAAVRNRNMTARLAWNPYLCNPALEPRLRRINIATLVVWGKQDRIIPLVHGELYAKRIAGAKLVVIDQCGHVPPVEQPDEFARIVGDFLAE